MTRCQPAPTIPVYLGVSTAPPLLVFLRGCVMLHCRLAGWLEMGTWTGFVGCLTGRETCVVDATVHCSAAQIAPRYALGAYTVLCSTAGCGEVVPRFPQGNDCSGAGRAPLASLMWNGVDTTWRATMPGWEDSRHATVSCNPTLQL